MKLSRPAFSCGFSLLELLVAIAASALIASLSYQFIATAIAAEERGREQSERMAEMERVWSLLSADIAHLVDRPMNPAEATPAATGMSLLADGETRVLSDMTARPGSFLMFVRQGWSNPVQASRSELQRVLYRIDGQMLWRDYWQERGQALYSPPQGSQLISSNIENVLLRVLPRSSALDENAWTRAWLQLPASSDNEGLAYGDAWPLAVEIDIEFADAGSISRLFLTPGS